VELSKPRIKKFHAREGLHGLILAELVVKSVEATDPPETRQRTHRGLLDVSSALGVTSLDVLLHGSLFASV
jgi:hypothetical protein